MRVLVLSKYDRLAASPRVRYESYTRFLDKEGIRLEFAPLLGHRYLERMFAQKSPSVWRVIEAYTRRLITLFGVNRWDAVLIQYEIYPYLPAWIETALASLRIPYVVDYDDAIFHQYDQHRLRLVRKSLKSKIACVMQHSRAVIVGSEYLATYAKKYNRNTYLIPSVVEFDRYRQKSITTSDSKTRSEFCLGWIGSPSSFKSFHLVEASLARLGAESAVPIRLITVGAPKINIPNIHIDSRPWVEQREIDDLLDMDVGLMPLADTPFYRGKCAYKLIQYMACGLPTVCSPVGANCQVVNSETGLFASDSEAWLHAFRRLRDHPKFRHELGLGGRKRVKEKFSSESQAPKFIQALKDAVAAPKQQSNSRLREARAQP